MGKVIMSGIVPKLEAPSTFPPIGTALNDMTWEEIRAVSDDGLASSYFSAGDTKTIVINGTAGATTFSNLSVDVFIIGIDHNSATEGTNRIHFQIGKIEGKDICLCDGKYTYADSTATGAFQMNRSNQNSNGWDGSPMRKTILGSDSVPTSPRANTLLSCLPSDLRAVMKSTTKYTNNTGGSTALGTGCVTATTDYLWLLSEFEVQGKQSYANKYEQNQQAQYDYYKAGNSKVKNKHNATGTAATWWLRSPETGDASNFCCVYTWGSVSKANAVSVYGISPGFAV